MSSNPITSHDNEQPASEWASDILNPAPETPGVSMPGSFPIPKQDVDIAPGVQGAASDAFKTAKEYAQFAAQGAQTAVQSAGGKVGEYLPSSVSSYLCKLE